MKRAILLLNMGGPNNPSEVKIFLNNMFNDPRIISAPKLIRRIVSKIIIAKRLKSAVSNYELLGGRSPLVGHTQKLIEKLKTKVDADVYMVMRYTPPFADHILENIKDFDEIYAIPLYPQHSSTTTLSSFDDLFIEANKLGIAKKIKTYSSYQTHPLYIKSIVERIKEALNGSDANEYELIFSAHGLPQKVIDKGDLYKKHIKESVEAVKTALQEDGIKFAGSHLAYQSRLGPIEWLRPYMDEKLHEFENKKVIVFPVSFTIDNSETECELDIEYRHLAKTIGITDFRVAKAPNDSDYFAECLVDLYDEMKKL